MIYNFYEKMFTGLVENTWKITSLKETGGGLRMTLDPTPGMEMRTGDSISVNGVCLTVVETGSSVAFEISPETMRSTNLGELKVNNRVNLERALRLSDRLGGHIVTGHVDGIGAIIAKKKAGDYTFYTFEAPADILKYTVKKGSVAVDGISLTVNGLDSGSFSAAIIPHTLTATNIGKKGPGDRVNIEVDIIGKYIEKLLNFSQDKDTKLMGLLREEGFAK
ncbi:MAG TPA: riboflavin synthase [Nitrospirae bacterium]|nr:riboflavin synthase [bacterium BMS3Abin10]GBE38339.1 riboflavin synthase [bacterium BMS3Bbin08]HDH01358.1 riboflavin synthase [Nitrospirota bacterium]HDO26122.1 riboflavin synthase [Nitrospirota bacterium]